MVLAADVYAEQLCYRGYGLPLWVPEPSKFGEVQIGDIGYVDRGGFYRIFNATFPADHPINQYGVPPEFEVLDIDTQHVHKRDGYLNPGPLCSRSVREVATMLGGSSTVASTVEASYRFKCNEDRGALLVLKDYATSEDVHQGHAFETYIRKHHESWCSFARNHHGLSVKPEEIMLVKGCVKTTEWAVAAFLDKGTAHEISFQAGVEPYARAGFSVSVSSHVSMSVEYRSGPTHHNTHGSTPFQLPSFVRPAVRDQCIFVAAYKLKRRRLGPVKVIAAADHNRDHGSPSSDDDIVDISMSESASDDDVCVHPQSSVIRDPLEAILDCILENSDAEVAVASHSCFRKFLSVEEEDTQDFHLPYSQICSQIVVDNKKTGILSTKPSSGVVGALRMTNSKKTTLDRPVNHTPLLNLSILQSSRAPATVPRLSSFNEILVPQRPYGSNIQRGATQFINVIEFRTGGQQGISLIDAQAPLLAGLEHPDDRLLDVLGVKVTYRVEWPGYPSFSRQKYPLRTSRATGEKQSISRAEMAIHVAEVMKDFIEEMAPIATSEPAWRVGPGAIEFSEIYLLEIRRVSKASLQPVLLYRPCHTPRCASPDHDSHSLEPPSHAPLVHYPSGL